MKLCIMRERNYGGSLTVLDDNDKVVDVRRLTLVSFYDSRDEKISGYAYPSLDCIFLRPSKTYTLKDGRIPVHRTQKAGYLQNEHIFIINKKDEWVLWCDLAYLDMRYEVKYHKASDVVIQCKIALEGTKRPFTNTCWTDGDAKLSAWVKYGNAVDALKRISEPSEEEFSAAIKVVQDCFRRWKDVADAAAQYTIEDYLAGKPFLY